MPNNIYSDIHNSQQHKPANGGMRSKHRLAEISHHFLSNEDDRLPAWDNTTVIPVLLGSQNDDYVVYELDRAFNQQNSSSMVLNIENRLAVANNLSALAGRRAGDASTSPNRQEAELPDYCLIPASSPSTVLALQCERLIICVHASLSGVRVAYEQLAFIATLDTDFDVCVIMLGAKNKPEAKRFFGFLGRNVQSLLSLTVECGGYVLQNDGGVSSAEGTTKETMKEASNDTTGANIEETEIATDFQGVAAGLLRKFAPQHKARAALTRLTAPSGVAALLS